MEEGRHGAGSRIRLFGLAGGAEVAIEVELDNTFEVAREDDTVAALGVDGLDALDVAVGRDLQVVLDVEPVAAPAARRNQLDLPVAANPRTVSNSSMQGSARPHETHSCRHQSHGTLI